jgi:hypothetical protein
MWTKPGRTLGGGVLQKQQYDVFSEKDYNLVKDWWDTTTTISPNKKDVKKNKISTKIFELHATHYLHES